MAFELGRKLSTILSSALDCCSRLAIFCQKIRLDDKRDNASSNKIVKLVLAKKYSFYLTH